jgi:hypothetical protein
MRRFLNIILLLAQEANLAATSFDEINAFRFDPILANQLA